MQNHNLLSLAYLTVDGAPPVEHVEAAAAAGFGAAGLRILTPSHLRIDYGIVGNAAAVRDIRRACERTGIGVLDVELFTLQPDTDVGAFRPALETCAELGARHVQALIEDPDLSRAADRFAGLCDAAAALGLRVAVEFMRFRHLQTIGAAATLLAAAARANAGVLIDALHLARSGGTPADVARLPRERIAYMQLCDAPAAAPPVDRLAHEARNERLLPGDGALPLDALFDALPDDVAISVETPRKADAGRSVHERAKIAADGARRYLAGYRARRA
jgi:sugar phosphate isomerase/epimerase